MSESAKSLPPAEAAQEAVKAYIRMNRSRLANDGELLALLLPERFAQSEIRDLQRVVIERLVAENSALKSERDGLKGTQDQATRLGDGVRRFVLDLLDARCFADAIAVATSAASAFGADKAVFCVESEEGVARTANTGVRLIAPGTVGAVLGQDGMGAILSAGGELLLGPGGAQCKSLAVFRLKIGTHTPPALYVLGAFAEGRFDNPEITADLSFFARALERAIRAWLDLPKL